MKTLNLYSNKTCGPLRHVRSGCQAFALVALIGTSWTPAVGRAEEAAAPAQAEQVLTRGPVHEAFAGVVMFNPEPGIVVAKAPPAAITEVPPGERPVGNNVTWIPGYWAWDDERSDFLWVSGTWRALPPGRQWIAGYWGETTKGFQWTSGYWADAAAKETTYLPAPPTTVETGPNVAAPSADYRWTPGNWMWNQGSYAWGPGYWARGRADWDWTPSHYMWTPRGYVFVDGYWDYPVYRRGSLFAPVYFGSGVYSHSGYSYTPSILLDLAVFTEALFLRPNYHHYYFGDYYDNSYQNNGYFSAYAYQSNRYGYDPIYSQQRWSHRQDKGWDSRMGASYQYRRDNVSARPPRTWDAQRAIATNSEFKQNRMLVATPIDQMAKRKDGSVQFQSVTKAERQQLTQRNQDVQKFRDERRTLETKTVDPATLKAGAIAEPTKVEHARSPIVAKSANQLGKGKAPPAALRSPKVDANIQPKAGTADHQPGADKGKTLPEPRKTAVVPGDKQPLPEPSKTTVTPRDKQVQPEPRVKQVQPEPRQKQVQPEPRQKQVQPDPRVKQVQPEPRQKQVQQAPRQQAPRQQAPTSREQPAAHGGGGGGGGGGSDKSNENDSKKKGKE